MLAATLAAGLTATEVAAWTVYVSNEKDNTISVVDSETMEVVQTVNVGQRPRGITISHDGKFIYLCASDDDTIEVIDTATMQIVGTLPSGPDPELFVLSPDGKTLYVANEDDNLVTVIDLESNRVLSEIPVGVEPEGMGVSPDGQTIVNTSETTNMAIYRRVHARDHPQRAGRLAPPLRGVHARRRRSLGERRDRRHRVGDRQCDTRGEAQITFEIPGLRSESIQPVGVRITADGTKAYVALGPANRVAVIDARTYEVEKYVLVGQRAWQLSFTPDQKLIVSTNGVSNDITFIDVASDEPVQSVTVGALPWGVVVSPK